MNQDYALMQRMTVTANVYAIITKCASLIGDAIHSLTTPERRQIDYLRKLGVM